MSTPRRRLTFGIALATVLAVSSAAVVVRRGGSARWDELQTWLVAEQRAWDARDFSRPVLVGEATPGNAFVHYRDATTLARRLLATETEDGALVQLRLAEHELAPEAAAAIRACWKPAVAAMRAGARCAEARPLLPLSSEAAADAADLLAGRWICNMACDQALRLLDGGSTVQAVERTLEAATFGADHTAGPTLTDQMIGTALLSIATSEFWTDARLARLDAAALAVLADGLRSLDAQVPATLQLRGDVVVTAHATCRAEDVLAADAIDPGAWRHALSARGRIADAVFAMARAREQVDRGADLRWPEREAAIDRAGAALASSGDPAMTDLPSVWIHAEHGHRRGIAQLRMLRIAVELRLDRAAPAIDDPLGTGPLRVVESADGVQIVSDGRGLRGPFTRSVAMR